MDEQSIEQALRAGPPDELPHRQGAFARALAAREHGWPPASSFRVAFRPGVSPAFIGLALVLATVALVAGLTSSFRPSSTGSAVPSAVPSVSAGPSTATPSPSDVPSPAAEDGAPVELVDRWLGPVRTVEPAGTPASRAVMDIRGAELRVAARSGHPSDRFVSGVSRVGADLLRLTSLTTAGGCEPYDVGDYRWSLSPARTSLTLELLRDDCQARSEVLPATWTHTACRDAAQDCLGPLEPGTYISTDYDPYGSGGAGQLTYAVPDGWANTIDFPTNYFIRPTADYVADPASDGNDTVSGIYAWAGTLAAAQPDDCAGVAAAGVSPSSDAIASYFASLPGLQVVDRGALRIDGRDARMLDLALDPTYSGTCPWASGAPFRSLITFADLGSDRGVWGIDANERERVVLLDVAPGRVVSIWVDGSASRFEALVAAAMPIIETFRFADPARSP
jgi:hypothetical protein